MRLQKYMAQCGIASRRKSEELIAEGKVKVNGVTILQMGYKVDETNDLVSVNDTIINSNEKKYYFAFHKPVKVITSSNDPEERVTVLDYFKDIDARLFTVGRLDYDSSGLIIVTNDGEFANKVTHPKYECSKTYEASAKGHFSKEDIDKLRRGVIIDGYKTHPSKIATQTMGPNAMFMQIVIKEGRNRQIRKMIESVGGEVDLLERTSVGPVNLEELKSGEYRSLSQDEIDYFNNL